MMRGLHNRYVGVLCVLLSLWAGALALNPADRWIWALENVPVVIGIAVLALTYRRFHFSRLSYTLIFVFLLFHEVGSHYTYTLVPYDAWFEAATGRTLNSLFGWERNHYDRLVHFLYGLLLTYPVREIFLRIANARGFWGYLLPVGFTMSTSLLYEEIEWAVVMVFGGDVGMAYLGIQGDVWDSHKDALLATIGSVMAMFVTAGVNISLQRDFAREWSESLRVKRVEPLGEEAIREMLEELEEKDSGGS
jgi:putative membrane protein